MSLVRACRRSISAFCSGAEVLAGSDLLELLALHRLHLRRIASSMPCARDAVSSRSMSASDGGAAVAANADRARQAAIIRRGNDDRRDMRDPGNAVAGGMCLALSKQPVKPAPTGTPCMPATPSLTYNSPMGSDALEITSTLAIPDPELVERFVRAAGPGGQNVNKVATAVELRFDVARSPSLPEPVRARLLAKRDRRMTADGVLVIDAQRFRTQERNRQDARERLAAFIASGLRRAQAAHRHRPPRGSKQRRLDAKRVAPQSSVDARPGGRSSERKRSATTTRPVLPPPPQRAAVKRNRFTRWLGRTALRLGGWRVAGGLSRPAPAGADRRPHSSNWDGSGAWPPSWRWAWTVRILGKHQLFWWPLGPILRRLGVIPVDRDAAQGAVEQAIATYPVRPLWFALTPEGTRKRVDNGRPVSGGSPAPPRCPSCMAYFHYPDKTIGIDSRIPPQQRLCRPTGR